jgi:hypothetical protein
MKYKKGKLKQDGRGTRDENVWEQNIQENLPTAGR